MSALVSETTRHRPVPARSSNPLLVVRLRGTQAEMGAQHGRILLEQGGYEAAADFYPELPRKLLSDDSATDLAQQLIGRFGTRALDWAMKRMEQHRPKAYLERTRAFIDALDPDRSNLSHYLMIMDVFQNVVGLAGRYGLGPFPRAPQACSTLMVWDSASEGGALRHARNFDLPGIGVWDRAPEVVFCEPDEGVRYGFVTTRGADTPGVTAFNEAGLTLTMHTRFHRDVRLNGAGVVDLGHDIIRRAETLDDAARIAQERPVNSTWGIAISAAREHKAIVIETTGKLTAVVEPKGGDDFLMATNRYRHPQTKKGEVQSSPAWAQHSDGREARIRMLAEDGVTRGGLTVGELGRVMGDHQDASAPGRARPAGGVVAQALTVKTIVAEPEAQRIRVSAGQVPASWGPWIEVPWSWDGDVGAVDSATPADEPVCDTLRCGEELRDGPRGEAYRHFVRAHQLHMDTGDEDEVLRALEQASTCDPDEPDYRFLLGAMLMKRGLWAAALSHFEAGLAGERAPFRRAQLLLWASRTARAAGKKDRARALREELLALRGENIHEHQAAARRERRRPFPTRRLRGARVNLELLDVL